MFAWAKEHFINPSRHRGFNGALETRKLSYFVVDFVFSHFKIVKNPFWHYFNILRVSLIYKPIENMIQMQKRRIMHCTILCNIRYLQPLFLHMIIFLKYFKLCFIHISLSLRTQFRYIIPWCELFMKTLDQNLIYGHMSCQDVRFNPCLYVCNFWVLHDDLCYCVSITLFGWWIVFSCYDLKFSMKEWDSNIQSLHPQIYCKVHEHYSLVE